MSEILGVLFAIAIGMMFLPKYADLQRQSNENSRAAATAQQQKQLVPAAAAYVKQNSAAIQAATTATTSSVITVAMLKAVNLLPSSFNATNPYGQTWQVGVLQPTAGNLQALVMSTGGNPLSDIQAGKIMAMVGSSGGIIPQNDSGIYPGGASNAYGAFAGWGPLSTSGYTSVTGGHLAALLSVNNGQLVSNYLYRSAVPGQPQLNQMNTAIDMQSNNLNNVGQVNTATLAASGDATIGGNASVTGTVSAAKVAVPAGNNLNVGSSSYYGDSANSAIRQSGGLYVQHFDGSSADIPQVGNINATGGITAAGTVAGGVLQPTRAYTANTLCGPNGVIGSEVSTGGILICKSSFWRRPGQLTIPYYNYVSGNATTFIGYYKFCTLIGIYDNQGSGTIGTSVTVMPAPGYPVDQQGYFPWQVVTSSMNGTSYGLVACYGDT